MTIAPQPLIAVADVPRARAFWTRLLDLPATHGGAEYERIEQDGRLVLQLHAADLAHHHGAIGAPGGSGAALWFATDTFDAAVARARELGAELVHDVHVNPNAQQRELWLRDPDGYLVVLAEAGAGAP